MFSSIMVFIGCFFFKVIFFFLLWTTEPFVFLLPRLSTKNKVSDHLQNTIILFYPFINNFIYYLILIFNLLKLIQLLIINQYLINELMSLFNLLTLLKIAFYLICYFLYALQLTVSGFYKLHFWLLVANLSFTSNL